MSRPSFTCPDCGAFSHHPKDIEFSYCGHCHQYKANPLPDAQDAARTTMSVTRDGHTWVAGRQCETCYFRPEHADGRTIGPLLRDAINNDRPTVCRETFEASRAVCRVVYELYGDTITALFIAELAGRIAYTEETTCPDSESTPRLNTPTSTTSRPPQPPTPV